MWSILYLFQTLFFVVLLFAIIVSKQRIKSEENRLFTILTVEEIVLVSTEILLHFSVINFGKSLITVFISRFFLVELLLWISIFSIYTFYITMAKRIDDQSKRKKIYTTARGIVYLFMLVGSILFMILPIYITYDGDVRYSYGPATDALKVVISIGIIFWVILLITNRHFIKQKEFAPIYTVIVLILINVVLQTINPSFTIASSALGFTLFIMFFTIENPDMKMVQALEIAKDSADKANNSKTEFLSSMSHEIRTPLNAIVGFSDCIVDAKTLDEAKENAKDIVNASQTLLEIVNGILDISKIEAGKMEIVNTSYDAKELFTEMAKLITPRMKEKGLDFTYSIDSNLPAVLFGDKANIKKIVTNFLSNACKYTDHGFVRYEVHSVKLGDYCRLIITVEDSGRGIKKSSIDKLFTRFQRLDEDRNTTIEGTGLGLAITKQLTELMGGKVIVHTIYGQGSKFTAVINQKIESVEPKKEQPIQNNLDLSNVRILIVDDAPLNLKVATKLMQKYNANMIETCSSGFECLDKIKNGDEYDLLFLDDMMPKMSGVETFSKLKQIPNFKIPTIALTANAITGMREKYLSSGFSEYLAKPIEQAELIRTCNLLLGRKNDEVVANDSVKEEDDKETELERTAIIPVEDNIEEIIGDAANLDGNFKSTIVENNDIEVLDDFESTGAATTSNTVNLIPVADIGPINTTPSTSVAAPQETTYDRKYLEDHGVDVNKALEMLGDMEMYNSTVQDFVSEVDEKWQRLNNYLQEGNMADYAIDVHSLKSDCKYLGFMSVADIAYDHELKSKEKNLDYVREHFPELEAEYKKTIDLAKEYAEHIN